MFKQVFGIPFLHVGKLLSQTPPGRHVRFWFPNLEKPLSHEMTRTMPSYVSVVEKMAFCGFVRIGQSEKKSLHYKGHPINSDNDPIKQIIFL